MQSEMPALLFKVKNQLFALDTTYVSTIFELVSEEVTPVPELPSHIKGIIHLRGEIIPLLEMRKILHMESSEEAYRDFAEMIDHRKADHIHWVNELKRCAHNHEKFELATDPHECKFGKWYDSYSSEYNSVMFYLRKIDAPHQALHKAAEDVLKCQQKCDECEQKECLKKVFDKAENLYMKEVLHLLDGIKEVFSTQFKNMCIVLSDDTHKIGIIVDEILSVEHIEFLDTGHGLNQLFQTDLVTDIARSNSMEGNFLVLNPQNLFSSSEIE